VQPLDNIIEYATNNKYAFTVKTRKDDRTIYPVAAVLINPLQSQVLFYSQLWARGGTLMLEEQLKIGVKRAISRELKHLSKFKNTDYIHYIITEMQSELVSC
jgi:hypothetical protein